MKNDEVLARMLVMYGPLEYDWMGYPITESNPITYHHIKKKSDHGKNTIDNGAILGKRSHRKLNVLEVRAPELYQEWNLLFSIINEARRPPNEEMREWILVLHKRTEEFMYGPYKEIRKLRMAQKRAKRGGIENLY